MQIDKIITNEKKPWGLLISDEGLEKPYPILIGSLHVPAILDTLISEGYQLCGLPYDIRKNNIALADLVPTVEKDSLSISDEEMQDMYDLNIGHYKTVDLKSKLTILESETFKFRKPIVKIDSREKLLNFLEEEDSSNMLPLNSFVARSALFSPDEFFAKENEKWRSLIERRREMSLKNFIFLAKEFVRSGLAENYTAKELVDYYFQWGIDGLNITPTDMRTETRSLLLGTKRVSMDKKENPFIRKSILTYTNARNSFHHTQSMAGVNYELKDNEMSVLDRLALISQLDSSYVIPVYAHARAQEEVTVIEMGNFVIEYNEATIRYKYNGHWINSTTLKVRASNLESGYLPTRFFNVTSQKGKERLFEETYLRILCRGISNITTVKTNVSSYKALLATGAGEFSAFWYLLGQEGVGDNIIKSLQEAGAGEFGSRNLGMLFKRYAKGQMNEMEPGYKEVQETVENIVEGILNTDSVNNGQQADFANASEEIYKTLVLAYKHLGIPLKDIANKIGKITEDTPYIDFKGNGLACRLTLKKKDKKLKGYTADRLAYNIKAAEEATTWTYVKSVFKELHKKDEEHPHHVAVELLTFDTTEMGAKQIIESLKYTLNEHIENNVPYKNQMKSKTLIPMLVAQGVFQIGFTGKWTLPETLGGTEINYSQGLRKPIQDRLDTRFETTFAITEVSMWEDGTFSYYCTNAIIMSDLVIPNPDVELLEKPFAPAWINSVDLPKTIKQQWVEKQFIPDINFTGYAPRYAWYDNVKYSDYENAYALMYHGIDPKQSQVSAPAYYAWAEQYRNEFDVSEKFETPKPYIQELYPALFDDEDSMIDTSEPRETDDRTTHKWSLGSVQKITRDEIFERFPDRKGLFSTKAEKLISLPSKGLTKFERLDLSDIINLDSFDDLDDAKPNRLRMTISDGKDICFKGKRIPYQEIGSLDRETYDITKITENIFIVEDIRGQKWKVEV